MDSVAVAGEVATVGAGVRLGELYDTLAEHGGQRLGAGQHRADRDADHADQRVPSAASLAGVGELGEVLEQAAALVAGQRGGCGRMSGRGDGGG